jgi:hypothetical protein
MSLRLPAVLLVLLLCQGDACSRVCGRAVLLREWPR